MCSATLNSNLFTCLLIIPLRVQYWVNLVWQQLDMRHICNKNRAYYKGVWQVKYVQLYFAFESITSCIPSMTALVHGHLSSPPCSWSTSAMTRSKMPLLLSVPTLTRKKQSHFNTEEMFKIKPVESKWLEWSQSAARNE